MKTDFYSLRLLCTATYHHQHAYTTRNISGTNIGRLKFFFIENKKKVYGENEDTFSKTVYRNERKKEQNPILLQRDTDGLF